MAAWTPTFRFVAVALAALHAAGEEPHFLASTDNFLRASSSRVGEVASDVLGVKSRLDDMRQDLSGEYVRWQEKQKALNSAKSLLEKEVTGLRAQLVQQKSIGEEKVRLEGELALHKSEILNAEKARDDVSFKWAPQQEALQKDIELLEVQIRKSEVYKIQEVEKAANQTAGIQARNRAYQSQIYTLNQQVVQLEQTISNRSVTNQQRHSALLSEINQLQLAIHALQEKAVQRSQVQLEVQQQYTRVAAQASEVVQQKEELQRARVRCEEDLRSMDEQIRAAQASLKDSTAKMAECQGLDAEAQNLQGQLNQCRAAQLSSR